MPFIFHAQKKSIFQIKQKFEENSTNIQTSKNNHFSEKTYKVGIDICKDHPFRINNREEVNKVDLQCIVLSTLTNKKYENIKPQIAINELNTISDTLKSQNQNKPDLIKTIQSPNLTDQFLFNNQKKSIIHEVKDKLSKNNKNASNLSQQTEKRMKFPIEQTPGPGSYFKKYQSNNSQSYSIGPNYQDSLQRVCNKSILEKNVNASQYQKISEVFLQNKQKSQNNSSLRSILSNVHSSSQSSLRQFSYKNQISSFFKDSSIKTESTKMKKNRSLLNMLFSNKKSSKQNDKFQDLRTDCNTLQQLSCQQTVSDDEFQKLIPISPTPYTYNPNCENSSLLNHNKNKVFISGTSRFQQTQPFRIVQQILIEKPQKNVRQHNLTKIQGWKYKEQQEKDCAFYSKIKRELHFDNENLCKQEFYYSPKNNFIDQVNKKLNKKSNLYFGSTAERINDIEKTEVDPYKYCFSKVKMRQKKSNCASFKLTEQRKVFQPLQNLSPNTYLPLTGTIKSKLNEQIFKKLIKSKYKDEVVFLDQKKKNMRQILAAQNLKKIDIKSSQKSYPTLNLNNYKQYLLNKKRMEKQNISFGTQKSTQIKRFIQGCHMQDLCYEKQLSWNKQSFNKLYGYQNDNTA